MHCSSPHICRWVARPPGCPSDTAHRHTSCTLLAKARAQPAHTCCSSLNTSPKRYYAPVPCLFSLYSTGIYFILLISNRIFYSHTPVFRSVSSAVYQVLHIIFLSHYCMCSSESLLFFSFIWSSLSLPLALLHALFCLWGSFGSDS